MALPLRIKICGVTTPDDVRACADAGADAVGLNFHPKSPRYVDPRSAQPLLRSIPPLMAAVGVFVEQPLRQVCAIAYQLGLRAVQWHGEQPETDDPFPFQFIPAFRIKNRGSLDAIDRYLEACALRRWQPGAVLVDSYVDGQHGGTGRTAPWDALIGYQPAVPLILAGGLTPNNVDEAIALVRPWGIDVASGVESSPGKKDHYRIRRFIDNARAAAARLES